MARQVTMNQLKRHLDEEQRQVADRLIRSAGVGLALYRGQEGRDTLMVSYGNKDSDCPGLPPSNWGSYTELVAFCPPGQVEPERKSPLKDWKSVPQISVPRSPSQTQRPDVVVTNRTKPEPRPEPNPREPLLPSRDRQPVEPNQEKGSRWW